MTWVTQGITFWPRNRPKTRGWGRNFPRPGILEAAVVAKADEHWGETPCAFVHLREGSTATPQDIMDYCREHLAHFKAPKTVIFGELPKTSTGKIQKFKLREQAEAMDNPAPGT
ncbi:MAG: hypothetical protein QF598_00260 [Arenicellales bacterium]|nr:hypothetical protein [Arenicellales bacterium]